MYCNLIGVNTSSLKCFSILDKDGKYQFWVIGKAESENHMNKLSEKIKELRIADKVKFWGYVPDIAKFNLLKRSHVLVNPSVHEGWGLVNIEANSTATPVVCYKSSGLVDSVKDNISGIVVKSNTPEELANTIKSLLNNEDRYRKIQEGALSWSRNFSWDKSRKLSLDLINSLLL